MPEGTIDKLNIEVGASTDKASKGVREIVEMLKQLRTVSAGIDSGAALKLKDLASALGNLKNIGTVKINSKLPEQLSQITNAVSGVSDDAISRIEEAVSNQRWIPTNLRTWRKLLKA